MRNKYQPYVGPRPFELEDQALYFGREREAEELLSLIIAHEVVLIYAPSGAGKTSLLNAKLIPRLKEDAVEILPVARVGGLIHEDIDFQELPNPFVFNTLVSWAGDKFDPKQLTQMSLGDYLNSLEHPTIRKGLRSPRVAIFDQFEELFYAYQERWGDRKNFFEQVANALDSDPLLRVVFVIREDYLAQLDPYTALLPEKLRTRYHLERLGQEAALLAVKEPLRETDRHFAKGIAEKLANDLLTIPVTTATGKTEEVIGEFVEPVQLQLVCNGLWESLADDIKEITKDHLKVSGDVTQALSQYYEQSIMAVCEAKGVTCGVLRKWFENTLITPASTRGMVYRGAEETAGIPNAIIDALEKRYIIRGEMRGGARWYELTHDRFIEPILASNEKWRSKQRGAEQTRDRLEEMASLWVHQGRGSDGLLDEAELGRVERWLTSSEAAEVGCSEEFQSFVKYSRAIIEAAIRQRELEQAQALRELEQAQALAEEQRKRAEEKARTARNLRRLSIALVIAVALAVGAFITASIEFLSARKDQRTSLSRDLAWAAKDNLNGDPERGLLLALHAASVEQSTMTEEILHQAVAASRSRLTIFAHIDQSLGVAYSPDGKLIATCGDDNTARIWDAKTGEVLDTLSGHTDWVRGVAFSPDGERIATCSNDSTARVWNTKTGEELLTLYGHIGSVMGVAFSPDGKRIATCSADNFAGIWDANTGEVLNALSGHTDWVRGVAFSPDGERIATCSDDNTAIVWDANTGEELHTLFGHSGWVRAIAFSPDGKRIATCSDDNYAGIWDANNGELLIVLSGHTDWVTGVAFSPDGQRIATCSDDNTAIVWDANTSEELFPLLGHTGSVRGVAFSPDGKHLASASADGTVKVWRTSAREEELLTLSGHTDWVTGVAFSPDGERMATCSDDSTAIVWDARTGGELLSLSGHTGRIMGVAFSPDGKHLASASADSTIKVWRISPVGKELLALYGHADWVRGVAFSPDGLRIATCSDDSTARVWDTKTGKVLDTLSGHTDWVRGVAFSPDGERIATCSNDSTARIWDANTGGEMLILPGHAGSVRGVVFSPDGERIATCSDDNTARIWDANTGSVLHTLSGHTRSVNAVAFSPGGTHLVTSSTDGTAKVWDTESGDNLYSIYSGPGASFSGIAFNPDGQSIAIASSDGTVRLFLRKFDDLMALARERVTRSLTQQEVEEYLHRTFLEYLFQDQWPLTATGLVFEGRNRAVAGDVESAILIFRRALELDDSPDLDPEVEAGRWATRGLVSKGEDLANGGNVDSAVVIFRRVLVLDPTLNSTGMASFLVATGGKLAQQGKIREAITAYTEAQKLDSTFEISARSWNALCWFGSLHGAPADVIFAGEQAVEAEPDNGNYRDTRGLARALLGDYQQAIEDFNFFIDWANDYDDYSPYLQSRKDWIATLEAGQNPFDKETLEAQLGE